MTLQMPASLVQLFDEPFFNYPIDDRVVEKIVYRQFPLAFPFQDRLNDRRLHSCVTIQILDGILIGLVEAYRLRPADISLRPYRLGLSWF